MLLFKHNPELNTSTATWFYYNYSNIISLSVSLFCVLYISINSNEFLIEIFLCNILAYFAFIYLFFFHFTLRKCLNKLKYYTRNLSKQKLEKSRLSYRIINFYSKSQCFLILDMTTKISFCIIANAMEWM